MTGKPRTAFFHSRVFYGHVPGPGHPERPERLDAVLDAAQTCSGRLLFLEPPQGRPGLLRLVHASGYIGEVRRASESGSGCLHTPDNPVSTGTYEAAASAAAAVAAAIDAVMEGKVSNAFCAVRPPGHHALRDRAMGFCFFNSAAIGAKYFLGAYGPAKTAIVDWDVHHGNGTQEAFYRDPEVLYISIHQAPLFPGTGSEGETGSGRGRGANMNITLGPGSGDREYAGAFEEKVMPALESFRPDFIIVSAGFDAHGDDPVGGMRVSAGGFSRLTGLVRAAAEGACGGKLVSVLEGGYSMGGLRDSVRAHIDVLSAE